MRSSGSTRNHPDLPIRLGIVLVGDDHPRACTGRRLVRLGLARERRSPFPSRHRPVVLDPYAPIPLTAADGARAAASGLVAIDCSWNRLSVHHAAGESSDGDRHGGVGRRLPMLVAANPQHFGRLGELNTAEALAAALFVLGRPERARELLDGFAGGWTFLEVNRERLERYALVETPEELRLAERALFGSE